MMQPAGLGDIFYTQKIAKEVLLRTKTKKIIWPVKDNFIYLQHYLKDDNIEYVKKSEIEGLTINNSYLLSLQNADERHRNVSVMSAKYIDADIEEKDVLSYFNYSFLTSI